MKHKKEIEGSSKIIEMKGDNKNVEVKESNKVNKNLEI